MVRTEKDQDVLRTRSLKKLTWTCFSRFVVRDVVNSLNPGLSFNISIFESCSFRLAYGKWVKWTCSFCIFFSFSCSCSSGGRGQYFSRAFRALNFSDKKRTMGLWGTDLLQFVRCHCLGSDRWMIWLVSFVVMWLVREVSRDWLDVVTLAVIVGCLLFLQDVSLSAMRNSRKTGQRCLHRRRRHVWNIWSTKPHQ